MRIALASDHAGFRLKQFIKDRLIEMGHDIEDFGADSEASCDYPDHGRPAAEAVASGKAERAVLVCGTGQGMAMTANKLRGIRAALCFEPYSARMARAHNNANVLVLAGRLTGEVMAEEILAQFLATKYDGGRHDKRLEKMEP